VGSGSIYVQGDCPWSERDRLRLRQQRGRRAGVRLRTAAGRARDDPSAQHAIRQPFSPRRDHVRILSGALALRTQGATTPSA